MLRMHPCSVSSWTDIELHSLCLSVSFIFHHWYIFFFPVRHVSWRLESVVSIGIQGKQRRAKHLVKRNRKEKSAKGNY